MEGRKVHKEGRFIRKVHEEGRKVHKDGRFIRKEGS
jgi:hypothetical protein